jgi:Domain of unknown function (DUF4351)
MKKRQPESKNKSSKEAPSELANLPMSSEEQVNDSEDSHSNAQDTPWKQILDNHFPEFMRFFFHEAASQIDWQRGYEFLDKELQKVTRQAKSKRRYVDKLVKIWRKDSAQEVWILLHIEIQGQKEDDFPARMYSYHYRILDRYQHLVASFVVFTDSNQDWQPDKFEYQLLGSKLCWQYSTAKLLAYEQHWAALEQDPNPFAVVVMAHLKLLRTHRNYEERYRWKFHLCRSFYQHGYSQQQVHALISFIDWLMILPPALETKFQDDIYQYERSISMPYVSSFERRARQEGQIKLLTRQLQRRFDNLSPDYCTKLLSLPTDTLESLGDALLDFQHLDDLDAWLNSHSGK